MTAFTVEVTTAPVLNGDWELLRSVLDLVPGTLLIEDAEEPVLIFPVEAHDPMQAALFVDGVTKLTKITLISGRVAETPPADFAHDLFEDEVHEEGSPVVFAVREWMEGVPEITGRVEDGRLLDA